MNNFDEIEVKLKRFVKKFHVRELIKGFLIFLAISVMYLLTTIALENVIWFNTLGRLILFWSFVIISIFLFVRFVVIPVFKILNLTKGMNFESASIIIGRYFPEVDDKLLNVLQLNNSIDRSDLLLASIDQKSADLKPIPFLNAVDFKDVFKYLRFVMIPVLLIILIFSIGKSSWLFDGYKRVVNYNVAYAPPAPFTYTILNNNLQGLEDETFVLQVMIDGEYLPNDVSIYFEDETYFLKNKGNGLYEYMFDQPKNNIDFFLKANGYRSKDFTLNIVTVPSLLDLKLEVQYPPHINNGLVQVYNNGNATIPEGSSVHWLMKAKNTDVIQLSTVDTIVSISKNGEDSFSHNRKVYNNLDYDVSTSNANVNNYEKLSFSIDVIKDQYPELNIQSSIDSLNQQSLGFLGRASDDYGIKDIRFVYYDRLFEDDKITKVIGGNKDQFYEFVFSFPGDLSVKEGVDYECYFEVRDNDVVNGFKVSKSKVFSLRKFTEDENTINALKEQNNTIEELDKTVRKAKEQESELDELNKLQKEKKSLDFNDQKRLEEFLKRQKKQENLMKEFSDKLKENVQKIDDQKKDPFKDALKERIERNSERLEKNKKLLEEIQELSKKISKEDLTNKLEKLKKQNKSTRKSLEQILELTKRYYVFQKQRKIADLLNKIAEEQEQLSEKNIDEKGKEKQKELNKKFDELQKEMKDLEKKNEELDKPMDLGMNSKDEEISKDQKEALENMEQDNEGAAKKKQKSAAQKMKQMSQNMMGQMQMNSDQQLEEDSEMLRQILDNLVDFSLGQEGLMKEFKGIDVKNPIYSTKLKQQSVLRENFVHIDDSLYALALRTPSISDKVIEKLTDIDFNIEKALGRLSENQVVQGTANQQYSVTGANDLAVLLSDALNQMQNSMSAPGKGGSGKGEFQLPDIIKGQEQLNSEMQSGMQKGEKPGQKEGEQQGEGEEGEQGSKKEGGKKDGEGKDDKNGEKGKGKGKNKGDGSGENGEGEKDYQEDMNGELFEIFKRQQELRNQLEDKIKEQGMDQKIGSSLLRQMEKVEQDLLEKGFNENTLSRMRNLKHQLIKLKDASMEQGEKEERESKTNYNQYDVFKSTDIERVKRYFNNTEILNKQVLPLQKSFKRRVQEYFKHIND